MNWFERYGIVGAYFLIILSIWFFPFKFFNMSADNRQFMIAIFAFAFLPVGYILTIFSQRIYYAGFSGKQIHREVLAKINKDWKTKLNLNDNSDEAKCEARMTLFLRLGQRKEIQTEALKYLTDFSTRRWDTLAINRSMILSTILPIIIFLFIISLRSFLKIYPTLRSLLEFLSNSFSLISLMILTSLAIIVILMQSNKILGNQVMQVLEDTFNKIQINNKEEQK